MKSVLLFSVVVLMMMAFSSCKDGSKNFPAHQKTLDSLSVALDAAIDKYEEWNIDSLSIIKADIDKKVKEIGAIFTSRQDTMTFKQGILVGDFKSGGKVFRDVKSRHAANLKEISLAKDQLSSLHADIKSGAIKDSLTLSTYVYKEKKAIGTLINGLNNSADKFNNGVILYNRLQPKVVHLLDSLQSGNNF